MSLRSKIVLILIAVIGIYALTTDQIQRRIFLERFEDVEDLEARQDLLRVREAIYDEIDDVDQLSLAWSSWDEAYAFLTGERVEPFVRSNLDPSVLERQRIDLLYFLALDEDAADKAYEVVWSDITDPDTGEKVRLREFPTGRFHASHPILVKWQWEADLERQEQTPEEQDSARWKRQRRRPVGILLTEHKPLLVSARPVLDSRETSKPAGILILGRFLSDRLRSELRADTRVNVDFWQADGRHELPPDAQAVLDEATAVAAGVLKHVDRERLHVWGTFPDFHNRPELLLRVSVERDVTATGASAVKFGFISAVAGGFVLLLALTFLLQKIVLAPLSKLTAHAVEIGKTENFRAELGMLRSDEVGTLSQEFDRMMAKLEAARAALVDTARAAGMSEIATGILHNVGNVLNSVNISASLVSQNIEGMNLADLQRIVDVLGEHKDDLAGFMGRDPKGKHLQPFLHALSIQLGDQQRTIFAEMGSLTEGIDHICDLIKSQQSFAVQAELVEELFLSEKVDEALRITGQAVAFDPKLEVVRDYEELPEVLADKHRLLEILVNLIQNARQAMEESGGQRRLTLRVRGHGEDRVRLQVEDTGPGIAEDVIAKVFNLGFTTRPGGHGYGLHTAANAATEMGGVLSADSAGPGKGATFTLELPVKVASPKGGLA